jgi:hypothetical protein
MKNGSADPLQDENSRIGIENARERALKRARSVRWADDPLPGTVGDSGF